MTDITADEYRTAAKVAIASDDLDNALMYERAAVRLSAVETPDLVTELAKVICVAHGLDWEWLAVKKAWEASANDALTYLSDHGRLVPEGGMPLTAEQVEDVRTVAWYTGTGLSRAPLAEIHRLRALFPATEPAEESQDIEVMQWDGTRASIDAICKWVNSFDDDLDDHTMTYCFTGSDDVSNVFLATLENDVQVSDGDFIVRDMQGHFRRRDRNAYGSVAASTPAPAVPAEEETKAEDYCCHPMCRHTNWGGSNRKHTRGSDCPIVPKPVSSPVVPAPTETGPWESIADVPDGVIVVAANGWKYRKGEPYPFHLFKESETVCCKAVWELTGKRGGPFVAAREGDA